MMSKMIEDMRNEAELRLAMEIAIRLIKAGKMSLEEIADCAELPLEVVEELEKQTMQPA